jgi:Bacterial membrane protein YfhO
VNPTWLYVAIVYALGVWLARRGGIVIPARVAALYYLLVLIFLWKPLTGGWVNVPIDIIHTLPPWWRVAPYLKSSANREMNDIVLQIIPWAHQARQALRSFSLPLWNAMTGSGYPLLANGQSAPFSPVRLLALPLPLAWAITAEAALKVLIGATFLYLLARRRAYGELPSAIGGICFGFSTFIHVWLHFPLGTAAAFIPAAIYQIDLLAERITYRRFVFTACLWAAMLYTGHPETVSHATFLAGLYLLWIVFVERVGQAPRLSGRQAWAPVVHTFAGSAAAIACGALLAMPFIAPFLEAVPRSKRFQQLLVQPNVIGIFSDWPSKIILMQPHFFGQLPMDKPWAGAAAAESITAFAGILGVAAFAMLTIRAIAYRRFREREFFFVLATFFFLGVILGWPGIADVFHFLFKLAANARLRSMLCFLSAIQTAAALDLVRRERAWPFLAGLLAVALTFYGFIATIEFPNPPAFSNSVLKMAPSMLVLALAALIPLAGRFKHAMTMIVAVAVVAELFTAIDGWNPNQPVEWFYSKTPIIERMEKLKTAVPANQPFRIVGLGAMLFPNTNAMYGFEDVRVHDPMANGRYLGVLRVRNDYDPTRYFAKWENIDSRMLDYLNVRYILGDIHEQVKDQQRFAQLYDGKDGKIFENRDVLPRFFPIRNVILEFKRDRFAKLLISTPDFRETAVLNRLPVRNDRERTDLLAPRPPHAAEARLVIGNSAPTDFRMHVHAPRYTLIASSQPSWPGWHVTANGRTLQPLEINGAFLGFVVPPGESDVRVWYAPWSFRIGVLCMLAGVALLVIAGRRGPLAAAAR